MPVMKDAITDGLALRATVARCEMNLVLHIPDELAERLSADGDVERQALEALALESFRVGRLTKAELRQLLGFGSRPALDAFLLAHGIVGAYSAADLARDRQDLQRLGL